MCNEFAKSFSEIYDTQCIIMSKTQSHAIKLLNNWSFEITDILAILQKLKTNKSDGLNYTIKTY